MLPGLPDRGLNNDNLGIRIAAGVLLLVGIAVLREAQRDGNDERPVSVAGASLRVPEGWRVERIGPTCRRIGPGVLVTHGIGRRLDRVEIPNGCTNDFDVASLPATFAALDLSQFSSPPGPLGPDTTLPLSLERMARAQGSCACTTWGTAVQLAEVSYLLRVWIGNDASGETRRAVKRMVASIRKAPEP